MKTLIALYNLAKLLCLFIVSLIEFAFQCIASALIIGVIVGILVIILSPFVEPSTTIMVSSAVLVLVFIVAIIEAYLFIKDDSQ